MGTTMVAYGPMVEVQAQVRQQELLQDAERARKQVQRPRSSVRRAIGSGMIRVGFWVAGYQAAR